MDIGENDKNIGNILVKFGLSELRHFEMKKCRGNALNMSEFEGGEDEAITFPALEGIVVEECEMQEMPFGLLKCAPNLKSLSLANNKIRIIRNVDLAINKEK
jgi:hypothetical protein